MKSPEHQKDHADYREITIETLSAPPIKVDPAPLTRRIAAGTIDSVVLFIIWTLARFGFGESLSATIIELPDLTSTMFLVILSIAYYWVTEGLFAVTLGKFMLKIRVVGTDGEPCSFGAAFKRNIIRFIDWLPVLYLLGGLSILASSKKQRLGDRIADTIVSPAPEKDTNPPPAPFLFH